jgi:phosphoglycolate phosphatase
MRLNGFDNLLFDLDGTLVDSSATIAAALAFALERSGLGGFGGRDVTALIGRPLLDIFEGEFGLGRAPALRAVDLYREQYDRLAHAGTRVYPGVEHLLAELQQAGFRLLAATVKPTRIARSVLSGMSLQAYFSDVAGASLGPERRDKCSIIAHAVGRLELDPARSLMIGDRREDIAGARANGLQAIGVSYGFGSMEELRAADPLCVVGHPREIGALFV